jgi:hypothetical protein
MGMAHRMEILIQHHAPRPKKTKIKIKKSEMSKMATPLSLHPVYSGPRWSEGAGPK